MRQHKLFSLLSGLDRKAMTRFCELVHSPYFNKHRQVRALIDYLNDCYPGFDPADCDRRRIFAHLFPGEAHQQGKLAVLFTYTYRLAEQFLIQEALRSSPLESERLLLIGLRHTKAYDRYEQVLNRVTAAASKDPEQHSDQLWHSYRLSTEQDYYANHIVARRDLSGLTQMEQRLDHFYLAEKLKNAVEGLIRRNMVKVTAESRLLAEALREVADNLETYRQVPAIFLYYRVYEMLSHQDEQYYHEALRDLKEWEGHFPTAERAWLYNYFQNYCIREINRNNLHFLDELFQLYQSQLQQELLLDEGYLSEWHYKNIVTVGLRLSALDWVHHFIEQYRHRLRPESAENAYRFNLAAYYHAAGAYDKVLDLLTQVEYSDPRYNQGAKALLLRTYYVLEADEALFSLVDSFHQYLQRNRLMADSRRNGYYHLFRLTRRAAAIRARIGYDTKERIRKDLDKLALEIRSTPAIFNQSWLEAQWQDLVKIC